LFKTLVVEIRALGTCSPKTQQDGEQEAAAAKPSRQAAAGGGNKVVWKSHESRHLFRKLNIYIYT
jgi:hypothetical protein